MSKQIPENEPISGTFFLTEDGKVIGKTYATCVSDAYNKLALKIPFDFGKDIKRNEKAIGSVMVGSHVYEIRPLIA